MSVDFADTASVWIVHRESRARSGLARIAAAGENTVLGGPGDRIFESAGAPGVVVLGLGGDFERELEFAHRMAARFASCDWILTPEHPDLAEAARLFEGLAGEMLPYPPDPAALQRAIRQGLNRRGAQPFSQRRGRDLLSARFSRWFGDLEIPGLMRALDPSLEAFPLLIRGETGTGRGLIARYIHTFAASTTRPFVPVACRGSRTVADLLGQLGASGASENPQGSTIWLHEVDLLPFWLQQQLRDWIEFGLPESAAGLEPVRWMASANEQLESSTEQQLDPQLALLLSALPLHTPSLRTRPEAVGPFALQTAARWASKQGLSPQRFSEEALDALRAHPWPGNLRELESVVVRTISATSTDPILALHLRFEAGAAWGGVPAGAESLSSMESPPSTDSPRRAERSEGSDPALTQDEDKTRVETPTHDWAEHVEQDLTPSEAAPPKRKPVDLAALLDSALDDLRERIQSRRLLVLKELDRGEPFVLADAERLRSALSGLLARALASVPERGDMYLASNHHAAGLGGKPSVRVLLRYRRDERTPDVAPVDPAEVQASGEASSAELRVAEDVVRESGGVLTVDEANRNETVIVIDLPAAEPIASD